MKSYIAELKYSLHLIVRPFDGFWDLQRENRGSLKAALSIVFLTILTYVFRRQYTGFLFNFNQINDLNIILEIVNIALPFFLWCVANWCLTTLADGEGTFRDIVIATGYALTPLVLINLPLIPISYLLTAQESSFYYFFAVISVLWAGVLIALSTMVTHQYSISKTFFTIIGILGAMAVMVFLGLLFTSVIQQIIGFFQVIYREIVFRI